MCDEARSSGAHRRCLPERRALPSARWARMREKLPSRTLAHVVVPVGTALTHRPSWLVASGIVLLALHRILPRNSKDLLRLWLRIIPRRRGVKDKRKKGQGT